VATRIPESTKLVALGLAVRVSPARGPPHRRADVDDRRSQADAVGRNCLHRAYIVKLHPSKEVSGASSPCVERHVAPLRLKLSARFTKLPRRIRIASLAARIESEQDLLQAASEGLRPSSCKVTTAIAHLEDLIARAVTAQARGRRSNDAVKGRDLRGAIAALDVDAVVVRDRSRRVDRAP
jgi:hypothetical protein